MSCVPLLPSPPLPPPSIFPLQPFINCPPSSSRLLACLPVPRHEVLLRPGLRLVVGSCPGLEKTSFMLRRRTRGRRLQEGGTPARSQHTHWPIEPSGRGDWDSRLRVASPTLLRPSHPSTRPTTLPRHPCRHASRHGRDPVPRGSPLTPRESTGVWASWPCLPWRRACPFPDGPRCCRRRVAARWWMTERGRRDGEPSSGQARQVAGAAAMTGPQANR